MYSKTTLTNTNNYQRRLDNSSILSGMAKAMPDLELNIRLTINFAPKESGIIPFTESCFDIERFIIPKLKKLNLISIFHHEYGENWQSYDLIDICRYILNIYYKEGY